MTCYLLLCAGAALWIDLSRFHLGQNSDSLIPVLVSLQHWTPFYWEQSRFGMLVPLLAAPLEHPLANLLVQNGLTIFAGLSAIGLLTRFLVRSSLWFIAACGSCAIFLLCLAEPLRCDYLIAQPYGVSFSLALGALLLLDNKPTVWRGGLAAVMMLLAAWVNFAVGPCLLLIITARWAVRRFARRAAPITHVALVAIGTLAGFAWEGIADDHDPRLTQAASLRRWPAACATLLANAAEQGGADYRWTMLALTAAAATCLIGANARRRGVALRCASAFMLSALLLVLLAGRSRWTLLNECMPRYIYVAMLALPTGLIVTIAVCMRSRLGRIRQRMLTAGAALGVLAAAGITYGTPSLHAVQASLEQRLGAATDEILQAGCTHVAGDYWRVWPAVFHANLRLHEQGERRTIWGVTYRSRPTAHKWSPLPADACRIAVLGHDEHAQRLLLEHICDTRHFSFAFSKNSP